MKIAPTLRRFAGRCPPGGLISLGAALRKIVAPTVAHFVWLSAPRAGRFFAWGGPAQKIAPTLFSVTSLRMGLISLGFTLVTACGNTPPVPDWQANSLGAMKGFTAAYLAGDSAVADVEFARTKREISATGRPDLMARAELVRCAAKVASLVLDDCATMLLAAPDLAVPERAYAAYLGNRAMLDARQIALLPEQHRPMFTSPDDGARVATLSAMVDPLARLVAAGVLFARSQLPPAGVALAVDTASAQGWRRPLLAWLGVQLKLAQASGDAQTQASIQRRIDLAGGAGRDSSRP